MKRRQQRRVQMRYIDGYAVRDEAHGLRRFQGLGRRLTKYSFLPRAAAANGVVELGPTRRCSRRIRVSHPLPVAGRGWLRTVTRKGRATRPAAERQR